MSKHEKVIMCHLKYIPDNRSCRSTI